MVFPLYVLYKYVYALLPAGFIIPVKAMTCSVGTSEHATPTGTFYTRSKARWAELMLKSYGQYCTRIVGEVLFHSTPGNFKSIYNV